MHPPNARTFTVRLLPALLLLLLVLGCRPAEKSTALPPAVPPGCQGCHPLALDGKHHLPCGNCHRGNESSGEKEAAHEGVIAHPAHPEGMAAACGPCHPQIGAVSGSVHFTLAPEVNAVRQRFGAEETLASLTAIPVQEPPATLLALADDLLRRRCLRCHVHAPGDNYPATRHGTGCGACHLVYENGQLLSHRFIKSPSDPQCLACHYGNFAGGDYYGRFEHDYSQEYRTPFRPGAKDVPPYGIEYHQLAADIHQQKGLACIDCHGGGELMGADPARLSCASCHQWQPGTPPPASNLAIEEGELILTGRLNGVKHPVPPARHPAHAAYGQEVSCPVCHAQWSFNDQGTHLLRQDFIDYDAWSPLTVQGSSEVQAQLQDNLSGDELIQTPTMTDKVDGALRPGIWLQGYGQRRWEDPPLCPDAAGVLQICRPILDLHLSYRNPERRTVFDSVPGTDPADRGLRPYTPHTTGRAGAFYQERIRRARSQENRP